jgi:hypothetical protein
MNWIEEAFSSYQKLVADSNLIRDLTHGLIEKVYVAIQADIGRINHHYIQKMWGDNAELKADKDSNKINIKLVTERTEISVSTLSFYSVGGFYIDIDVDGPREPGRQSRNYKVELCLRGDQIVAVLVGDQLTEEEISRLSLIHLFQFESPKIL